MTRHSKNNAAGGVFTYHERKNAESGTLHQRMGADSTKDFDTCCLCLKKSVEPQACQEGHVYCRECIVTALVTQVQENLKAKEAYEAQVAQQRRDAEEEKEDAEARYKAKFERLETGILPEEVEVFKKRGAGDGGDRVSKKARVTPAAEGTTLPASHIDTAPASSAGARTTTGGKDNGNNSITARGDVYKFGAAGEGMGVKAFWIASQTPTAAPTLLKEPDMRTRCLEGDHPMKRKQLISLQFTQLRGQVSVNTKDRYMCPSCCKTLTNAPKLVTFKGCGHVICRNCFDKFVKTSCKCFVCDKKLKQKDIVNLQSGATGYSGHGDNLQAQRYAPSQRM